MIGTATARACIAAFLIGISAPAFADSPAQSAQAIAEAALAAAPKGTRFGLFVVDDAGNVIVSVNPDQRFIPASNTKMFTTAAAYALLAGMDRPDTAGGTTVRLVPGNRKGAPDVELEGNGDARMSGTSDCKVDCLATLADAVAAKAKLVGNVIAVDHSYPDERWSPGVSWNNIQTEDGTASGALNLDDNLIRVTVVPGTSGTPPTVAVSAYYQLSNEALTTAGDGTPSLTLERAIGTKRLRLYGEIPAKTKEWHQWIGIDDPAEYAAWTFKAMLEARGVKVTGRLLPVHRASGMIDQACDCVIDAAVVHTVSSLASLVPPPLADDLVGINKVSQNLHAQVLFRRLGHVDGTGSSDWAVRAEQQLFTRAGIPREGYDFSDGSGMSSYNRVSPRAAVALLRWVDGQPWGKAWYASLPIAGVDGTLKRRFVGTPLAGNLIAKTGTLNATNAISGTFRAASGKRLTFAFFANDVPDGQTDVPAMEAVLLGIAASN